MRTPLRYVFSIPLYAGRFGGKPELDEIAKPICFGEAEPAEPHHVLAPPTLILSAREPVSPREYALGILGTRAMHT